MPRQLLFLLAVCAASQADETVLDNFDYPTEAAAQAAWVPSERALPVGLIPHDDGSALKLNADFTGAASRVVVDRKVDWDLTRWGRFTLDVYLDDPGLIGSWTFYFQAVGGWYGVGFTPQRKGWQTIELSRAAFGAEQRPAGWDRILGVRIAGWRGAERVGFAAVDNLKAYREEKVIVLGSRTVEAGGAEARTVENQAERMAERLQALGLAFGTVTDHEVEQGALAGRSLAIFPYNPSLTAEEIAAIGAFVADGGKIMVFYALPGALAELLGLENVGYQAREYDDQFARIDLQGDLVAGLPDTLVQHSWNIHRARPNRADAKVLGWWRDGAGQTLDQPALLLSDGGMFMTHILLDDDPAAAGRLLLALVGQFVPEIWAEASARAVRGPERIGTFTSRSAVLAWLAEQMPRLPQAAEIRALVEQEQTRRAAAVKQRNQGQHPASVALSSEADELLRAAYLSAYPPKPDEFRAVWNHSGLGAYSDGWERSMQNLRENGFNAVIPNMLWGGLALYDSEYLPHSPVVAERGDQIAECVAAAKAYGIEVHPWKVNWNLGGAPEEFKQRLLAEDRLQANRAGETTFWLEPSDPRNLELELATMVEVATKYDVDGVHFDYIRYPGPDAGFSEAAKERFIRDTGVTIENWPGDVDRPEIKPLWVQWRCDNISRLVQRTAEEIRKVKPRVKISAAVFSQYPGCRETVGQDWVHWIDQGWLDFVCPMDYTNSDLTFATTLATQMSYIRNRIPFCPGIGATSTNSTLPADRVAGQIDLTRQMGADGFVVFNYSQNVAESLLPGLGRGILSAPAAIGFNGPSYAFDLGEPTREILFGRHVAEGETVEVTITRETKVPTRNFGAVTGQVVLEDPDGRQVAELATLADGPQTVMVTAPRGMVRVVIRGECDGPNGRQRFVSRSLPIVFGGLRADLAAQL